MVDDIIPSFGPDGTDGRPPKISEEMAERFCDAFSRFMSIEDCCSWAGISADTYYAYLKVAERWDNATKEERKSLPKWSSACSMFVDRAKRAQLSTEMTATDVFMGKKQGNWLPLMTWLSRRKPAQYGERLSRGETNVTVNVSDIGAALAAAEQAVKQVPCRVSDPNEALPPPVENDQPVA